MLDFFLTTVHSFVELLEFLFTIPGVKVFLSGKLSQDPLEKFFGYQRQRVRVNENPNAAQFFKNTQALRIVNSFCMGSFEAIVGDTINLWILKLRISPFQSGSVSKISLYAHKCFHYHNISYMCILYNHA